MYKPRVFVGYDQKEDEAYNVLKYSIKKHNSSAIVEPIVQSDLRRKGLYTRDVDPRASTEFSITRFLTPKLANYDGWALFMDCDFLCLGDIAEVFDYADPRYALMVVKHAHYPPQQLKMDNQVQMQYEKKNWSSCMLFNCSHEKIRNLTPEVVSSVEPKFLHRFWFLDGADIGELPVRFNFLVDYYKRWEDNPLLLHFTNGVPIMPGYENCDYSELWYNYQEEMKSERDF